MFGYKRIIPEMPPYLKLVVCVQHDGVEKEHVCYAVGGKGYSPEKILTLIATHFGVEGRTVTIVTTEEVELDADIGRELVDNDLFVQRESDVDSNEEDESKFQQDGDEGRWSHLVGNTEIQEAGAVAVTIAASAPPSDHGGGVRNLVGCAATADHSS